MTHIRFHEITKNLSFDLKSTRIQRLETDKISVLSDIWDKLIKESDVSYKSEENVVVEDQLFPSKIRCKFIQ